jgi:hypothetical protein
MPQALGAFLNGLVEGHSFGESFATGIGTGADGGTLTSIAIVMAFASVTANIRQAFIVILSAVAALAFVVAIASRFANPGDFAGIATAAGWVVSRTLQLLVVVSAIAVLWVQYRHRHTRSARIIAGVLVVIAMAVVAGVTWERAFAIQKMLAPEAMAPESESALDMPQSCFPLRSSSGPAKGPSDEAEEEDGQFGGEGLIPFTTRLVGTAGSADRRVVVDHAQVSWHSGAKKVQRSPGAFGFRRGRLAETSPGTDRRFVLPRADYARLAAISDIRARVDYSFSVLAPIAATELMADGRRDRHARLGWCGAIADKAAGNVTVTCYKPGAQPAMLTANLVGAPEDDAILSQPLDYTPAFLDFWGGQRHRMVLKYAGGGTPRVKVTAYEVRAHFDRQYDVPGVLGGPVSACPAH